MLLHSGYITNFLEVYVNTTNGNNNESERQLFTGVSDYGRPQIAAMMTGKDGELERRL